MKQTALSNRIYWGLVTLLALLSAISVLLSQSLSVPGASQSQLPVSLPVLALANGGLIFIVYGGLGYLGLFLARKLNYADLWDARVSNRQRFLLPALAGVGMGIFFILADLIFSRYNGIGRFPHPTFPLSVIASVTAGIGEEILFRLFFIPFWIWLISSIILKKRGEPVVFWIVVVWSALAFAMGHLPSLMYLQGWTAIQQVPPLLMVEIIALNGVISLLEGWYLKKYGYLAAVGLHFWTDVIWHVLWGIL